MFFSLNKKLTASFFACLLLPQFVVAQHINAPTEYPTLAVLEQTVVPQADPVALAKQLRGIGEIPPPPDSPPVRQVGEQETFWVVNDSENREFQVTATLRVVGEHIYMWLEDGAQVSTKDLQALADAFDNSIYDSVRDLWGSEASPGVDGDPRLYGLFAHGLGSGLAAYFVSRHIYPVEVYPTSNQHEMFFFNLDGIGINNIANTYIQSLVAHEFQHMIHANIQDNDALWLNEGLSSFTQLLLFNDPGSVVNFLSAPQTQLNTWTEDGPRAPHYGAATLFMAYFHERYGLEAIQQISLDPGTSLDAFDHVLGAMGEPDANSLFADWSLANFLLNPDLADGRYGYLNLPPGLPSPTPLATVTTYPFNVDRQSNQYASDYYALANLDGLSSLDIQLTMPETVRLIPTEVVSGDWMWYSNRGDASDMTLTQTFDLSDVESATLTYKTWFDIEEGWDYGYVMASQDDGVTWDVLSTANMTDENPHGNAYGTAYSGESNGWLEQFISLDAYVGDSVQIRFEMITDDGISQTGMAVDDVSIPEIGYLSDFETDGGGWETQGWVRVDNRLPQQAWVQAVQWIGDEVEITRWLALGDTTWTLDLGENTDQVILAISPFAPVTTEPMPYSLQIGTP
jgi:immune inhibitor A